MAMEYPCTSCQWGDHSGHIEWPHKPPPGVFGGHHCPCKGECDEKPSKRAEYFIEVMTQAFVEAQLDV